MIAIVYATIASSILGIGTSYLASKSGMNVNLMARGGGFGYLGASITSIIYTSNFIMYCAIEGAIMAYAVYEYFPIMPIQVYMIFFGLIVIPLNWFGIKQLDKIQKWSLPIYIVLLTVGIYLSLSMIPKYAGNPGVYIVQVLGIGGVLFTISTQLRINGGK